MFKLERSVETKCVGGFTEYFNSLYAAMDYAKNCAEDPDVRYGAEHRPLEWKWNWRTKSLDAFDERTYSFYVISEVITKD